jgi:hypothetical protein
MVLAAWGEGGKKAVPSLEKALAADISPAVRECLFWAHGAVAADGTQAQPQRKEGE